MEEAINAWKKDRDTAQEWVKCHNKSILHPKMLQIGTFNDLFQLIIYKFMKYQSKWFGVPPLKFSECAPQIHLSPKVSGPILTVMLPDPTN